MGKDQVLETLRNILSKYDLKAEDKEGLSEDEVHYKTKSHEKKTPEVAALRIATELVDRFYHIH